MTGLRRVMTSEQIHVARGSRELLKVLVSGAKQTIVFP